MDDFAAAAMMRVIALGLRRLGLALPVEGEDAPRSAHVPLARKRALLESLRARHGPWTLLRLGAGIRDARDEPALTALCLARSPHDLLERWQRLERFVHSRHRLEVTSSGENRLRVRHVSRVASEPPSDAEHLVILGLITELACRIGTAGLRAGFPGAPGWAFHHGDWAGTELPRHGLAEWEFAWAMCDAPPRVSGQRDEDCVQAAHRHVASDPARGWTVGLLARELNMSARSLQRRLQAQGASFSSLLLEARLAHSAALLASSRQPAAQIAFVCGFADQAHFARAFKRHTALTPGSYREQFQVTPAAAQLQALR